MKIYLLKTNAYNEIVFEENGTAKVTESAPSGKFEGIDLYSENTVEELKSWFMANAEDINFYCCCLESFSFSDILYDVEVFGEELILIYSEEK